MRKIIYLLAVTIMVTSCGSTGLLKSDRYSAIYNERPTSILVMPPINNSNNVEAKELFYSSLIVPLSQKGYYVMPPLLTMEILKEESAYDSEMFIERSMKQMSTLFGVDAVLFTTIQEWAKSTIGSQIRVIVEYKLISANTDEVLFYRKGDITYSPSANSGNILADILTNMLTTALTKEIEIGRKCNNYTLGDLPAGKYNPAVGTDGQISSGNETFKITLR